VRAAELRCRNDWGQDQWEAKVEHDTVLGVVMNDSPLARPPRVERGARPRTDIDAPDIQIPAAELTASPMLPISRADEEPDPSETARPVSADLNRELLRGAWERHRERQVNKGFSHNPPPQPEGEALVISNQYIPPSRDVDAPINRGLTTSVFEYSDTGNEAKFDAIPEIDEPRELPEIEPFARQQPPRTQARPIAEVRRTSPISESRFDNLEEPAQDDGRQGDRETRARVSWPVIDDLADPELPYIAEPTEPSNVSYSADDLDTRAESLRDPIDEQLAEPWEAPVPIDRSAPDSHDIWANIPRCCRTCRDFRPAGSGERGWCNNQWAFKHRRMVDSDDLPCETSVGHWWIPGDEAWQGEFDVSALGQPTPLMDRWFGRVGDDERTAEALPDRRRRKTGSW
jgi:hypothetical protein